MNEERDKKVIDVTFNSVPKQPNKGWGWRIPRNPARVPGTYTAEEDEVRTMAADQTPQVRQVLRTATYAYAAPFNYPNIKVELGRPGTGVEFNPDGVELDVYPYGAIFIDEEKPIVAVTIIGSACSSQGYVVVEAEPVVWKYPRTGVRMMRQGLWGIHVRFDAWRGGATEDWNDAGLSCARFDIPESRRIIVGGGGYGADPHYCVRILRVDVVE